MNEIISLWDLVLSHAIILVLIRDLTTSKGVSSYELFSKVYDLEEKITAVIREEASDTRTTVRKKGNDVAHKIYKILNDGK